MFATADSLRPRAIAIDLRHNHGGNNLILDPLVHGLIARPWLDRDGGIFVLTDRGTFSAAMNAAVFLETHTKALFAGEPTGGRVNHYGDNRQSELPNSKLILAVSEWPWSARVPWDDRPWIAPHLPVPSMFAAWRDAKDPVLDGVIDAVRNGTLQGRLQTAARTGGPDGVIAAIEAWSRHYPDRWGRTTESDLEALTVRLVEDDPGAATTVGEAWTRRHPQSAAAWRTSARRSSSRATARKRQRA
jgi:hypothetical protein